MNSDKITMIALECAPCGRREFSSGVADSIMRMKGNEWALPGDSKWNWDAEHGFTVKASAGAEEKSKKCAKNNDIE